MSRQPRPPRHIRRLAKAQGFAPNAMRSKSMVSVESASKARIGRQDSINALRRGEYHNSHAPWLGFEAILLRTLIENLLAPYSQA